MLPHTDIFSNEYPGSICYRRAGYGAFEHPVLKAIKCGYRVSLAVETTGNARYFRNRKELQILENIHKKASVVRQRDLPAVGSHGQAVISFHSGPYGPKGVDYHPQGE